ncbi:conserved exported hypothetical protein [uncultured Paludibacter sp.]|nr:conserved exported hypothetical protein [uncultured Paludibacter sp.]
MKNRILLLIVASVLLSFSAKAQFGIRVGVNMASEINSFNQEDIKNSFKSSNLTGYQVGLVYQTYTKGLGFEVGALLSQKGSVYQIDTTTTLTGNLTEAYKEINCINIPLNLRYRINIGPIGVFGLAGIYGDYALNGKTVVEALNYEKKQSFDDVMDRIDYGYTLGLGVEALKKIQLGLNWSRALKKKDASKSFSDINNYQLDKSTARLFSVNLTYLF